MTSGAETGGQGVGDVGEECARRWGLTEDRAALIT